MVINYVAENKQFLILFCSFPQGPMWRQIRGMGLSYNYHMSCHPDQGQLYFHLFKSSQLVPAFKEAKDIMVAYVSLLLYRSLGTRGHVQVWELLFSSPVCALFLQLCLLYSIIISHCT